MARKNAIIAATIADDASMLSIDVLGHPSIVIRMTDLDADIIGYAAAHGLKQKLGDAGALGEGSSPADKYNAIRAVADRIMAGSWDKPRGDGTGASSVAGIIYRAFAAWAEDMAVAAGVAIPDGATLRATYDAMDRKAQLGLRDVPAIAAHMDRLRAAKSPKSGGIDAAALLASIGIKPAPQPD